MSLVAYYKLDDNLGTSVVLDDTESNHGTVVNDGSNYSSEQHSADGIIDGCFDLDGAIEGLVSKSDIRAALSPYLQNIFSKWRRPLDIATLQIKVKWIMSRPVRTTGPDAPLAGIMENMRCHGSRCMPVVDGKGKAQGLVTVFDVFQALLSYNMKVSTCGQTPQSPPLM